MFAFGDFHRSHRNVFSSRWLRSYLDPSVSAVVIGEVDGRIVVRCKECKLVQFIGTNTKCKKCRAELEEKELQESKVHPFVAAINAVCDAEVSPPVNGIADTIPWMLKVIREANGFSQREMAKRLSVPRTWISKIENRKAMPRWGTLWNLCEVFDINPCWFLRLCEVAAGAK